MTETVIAIGTPLVSSVARLKGRARGAMVGAIFGSAWMSWAAVFVPTARTAALVSVTVIAILLVGWAIVACTSSSALQEFRRRPRALGVYRASLLDRHHRGMDAGCRRGGGTRSLWPLRANPAVSRSHHRTAFSSAGVDIESTSLLHYGNGHNCVRARLASYSRRQHPQRHRVRRDWSPDVDYDRGDLVPRLKAIPLLAQKACEVLSRPVRLPRWRPQLPVMSGNRISNSPGRKKLSTAPMRAQFLNDSEVFAPA
jgi:hypothetical protein